MSDDPDETDGRKLYRALADASARAQIRVARRKVKFVAPAPPPKEDKT